VRQVYELVGARWVDQGTAFCSGHFDESTNEAFLIARSEADYNNVILTTTIRSSDVYQRQQGTSRVLHFICTVPVSISTVYSWSVRDVPWALLALDVFIPSTLGSQGTSKPTVFITALHRSSLHIVPQPTNAAARDADVDA
jgi:hypothetical protein